MAFSKEEIIGPNVEWDDVPADHQDNILELVGKLNKIRAKWGKPMLSTSGYRSWADHIRIYKKKALREGVEFDESKIPKKSKHLFGQADDIGDADMKTPDTQIKEFQQWCLDNEDWLRDEVGVWIEHFDYTPTWVHFQSVPYGSYKAGKSIFFRPY